MIRGIPSSPGRGAGPAMVLTQREIPESASTRSTEATREDEFSHFQQAREIAADYYRNTTKRVSEQVGNDEAEIFEGYLEILTGEDMEEGVGQALDERESISAIGAVLSFCRQTASEFEELDSEYFRQRADDIRDIGNRLAEALHYGNIVDLATLGTPSIIIARELSPAQTVSLDSALVTGIATESGGPTGHAAILARSLSIPCITGASGLLSEVKDGQLCLLDGDTGTLEIDIDRKTAESVQAAHSQAEQRQQERYAWSRETDAVTSDGIRILLKANASSADDARRGAQAGALGSGLVRSEFIFMSFSDFPSIEQQAERYAEICRELAPNEVTIRLLDCGADKPLPYGGQSPEDNPFLGERGIRLLMNRPQVLADQLEAIAKVRAQGFPVKAMIPMVISLAEIREVKQLVRDRAWSLPVGIMVETPAALLRLDAFAAECDFFSIGTNDLVQYILAVDRGNSAVANLYQELHPAVLQAIHSCVQTAMRANIPLGVCGDMASRTISALALLSLGVRELSASSAAIPDLKEMILSLDRKTLDTAAKVLLNSQSHGESLEYLQSLLERGVGGSTA